MRTEKGSSAKVIFVHIPKAAGSTLHNILRRQYRKGETFHIDGGNVFESIRKFREMPSERRDRMKLVKGHMPFGLHCYLSHPAVYITMLRHPVDRIVSHYYYVLRTPEHYLHEIVTARRMTLIEYVTSGLATELDNGQTRLLADAEDVPFGKCSTELLETAKSNVTKHFLVAGLKERFNESLLLLQSELNWMWPIFYRQANVTAARPKVTSLARDVRDAIVRRNQLDLSLYAWVAQQFDSAVAVQADFRKKVTRFQEQNQRYQKAVERLLRIPFLSGKLNAILS